MNKFKEWLIIKGYSSTTIETVITLQHQRHWKKDNSALYHALKKIF
jgi:hypothetical protein